MAPVTAPIPSRIEDRGIQKPANEITDITNEALRGNYGERFVQCSLRGCHLNEKGSQSLPDSKIAAFGVFKPKTAIFLYVLYSPSFSL